MAHAALFPPSSSPRKRGPRANGTSPALGPRFRGDDEDKYGFAMRPVKALCLVALLLLPLAACGKKGPLEPPPDAPKTQYPRVYPSE
jgi:hypothetical protein